MKRVLWALAFAALMTVTGLTVPAQAGVFNPDTFTLSNDMRVVVIENHRVPVVTHMVWYGAGSADETQGETGTAHILEHLMFKGTSKRAPGEFSKILARNGGRENAFTSSDYTAYFQTIAVDRLELVMEMEADRMTNLVLTEKEVETEKAVVLEERRSRTDNNPGSILAEQVTAALYLNHPYRRPVIGWAHEIKAVNLDMIMAFYKKWYSPSNAILIVAGDITADKLKPLAEKYYGRIPAQAPTPRLRGTEPPQSAIRTVTLKDARVRQPSWGRAYLAPSLLTGETQHAYALEVLANIIGHGATSRLYRSLVVDSKLALSAGAYYGADNRGPGRFGIYASPKPGVSMKTLERKIDEELAKLLEFGVTPSELARAKKRMQSQAVFARDSPSGGARTLGAALSIGLTVEDVEAWPDRIGAITIEQISAAAKAVLKEGRSVTSYLLAKKTG